MGKALKKVVTYGTFDLFHVGHVRLLERLAGLGDHLTVYVSTDEFNALKGKKAVMPYEQRAELVRACRYVDRVLPEESWAQKRDDIMRDEIDIFAMGDDWAGKFDELSALCEVVYLPRTENVSSTDLRATINQMQIDEAAAAIAQSYAQLVAQVRADALAGFPRRRVYKRVWNSLLDIPEAARDAAWSEALLLCHARQREKAPLVLATVKQLRAHYRKIDQMDKFDALLRDIEVVCGENILAPHGYSPGFKTFEPQRVTDEINRVTAKLNELGHSAFLGSGTLLGAVREGQFLPHDDDVDMVVVLEGKTPEEVVASWFGLVSRLIEEGEAQRLGLNKMPCCKLTRVDHVGFDLFPAWENEGKLYVWPYSFGELDHDDLYPLARRELAGAQVTVPHRPERFLALNYGETWQVPDTLFSFRWRVARRKFDAFLSEYMRVFPIEKEKLAARPH